MRVYLKCSEYLRFQRMPKANTAEPLASPADWLLICLSGCIRCVYVAVMYTGIDVMHLFVYFGSFALVVNKLYASDTLVTDIVSFDITIDGVDSGTIDLGLFGDTVPLTVKNFLGFATGAAGHSYEGTPIHRVIEDFVIQGGDVIYGNGSGEASIYGGRFEDENFRLQHYGAGWVSMANAGPDTNTCQFFITARSTWWLDDKHVVFGKVVRGMWVLQQILNVDTNTTTNRPLVDVIISKSSASKPEMTFTVAKVGADWLN